MELGRLSNHEHRGQLATMVGTGPGTRLAHDAVSTSQQLEYIAISRDWQIARRGAYIILEFPS